MNSVQLKMPMFVAGGSSIDRLCPATAGLPGLESLREAFLFSQMKPGRGLAADKNHHRGHDPQVSTKL
jgi:hypothetical protein